MGFTRNPATGENMFFGEFLMNAQGEDVVAGIRTPMPISELENGSCRDVYDQLRDITSQTRKALSRHAGLRVHHPGWQALHAADPQRQAHRPAAVRIAVDMVNEKLITKEEAIIRVEPNQLDQLPGSGSIEKGVKIEVLAKGLPASPGAAVGQIVFTAEDAVENASKGAISHHPGSRRNHSGRHPGMEVAAGF